MAFKNYPGLMVAGVGQIPLYARFTMTFAVKQGPRKIVRNVSFSCRDDSGVGGHGNVLTQAIHFAEAVEHAGMASLIAMRMSLGREIHDANNMLIPAPDPSFGALVLLKSDNPRVKVFLNIPWLDDMTTTALKAFIAGCGVNFAALDYVNTATPNDTVVDCTQITLARMQELSSQIDTGDMGNTAMDDGADNVTGGNPG